MEIPRGTCTENGNRYLMEKLVFPFGILSKYSIFVFNDYEEKHVKINKATKVDNFWEKK